MILCSSMRKLIVLSIIAFTSLSVTYGAFPVTKNLSLGMSGQDVLQLQKFLAQDPSVYPEGLQTGYFGNLTQKAVKAFQKKHGVEAVGLVGPKTKSLLNKLMQEPSAYSVSYTPFAAQSSTSASTSASTFSINNIENHKQSSVISSTTTEQGSIRVIIKYKNTPGNNERDHLDRFGGKFKRSYKLVPAISAEVPAALISQMLQNPNITSIEKDVKVRINAATAHEYNNTWGVVKVGGDIAYQAGHTGKEIKVAVIDTGIDYRHTDINYAGGFNFINNSTDAMDDNGHGTHVAGIISALGNGTGVVGVSPDIKIYGLKVLDSSGSGYTSDIISAIEWAMDNGIHITNNSYGIDVYPGTMVEEAFKKAETYGILHIAAAGNSGTCAGDTDAVNYPAKFSSVVAVAATDSNNNRACFSSSGPEIELSAPGINIYSTQNGGGYVNYSGTSVASPHVSGVAAVIYSAGAKDLNGNFRINDDVRMILNESALDLGLAGGDTLFGNGLVKADSALDILAVKLGTSTTTGAISTPKLTDEAKIPEVDKNKIPGTPTSTIPRIPPLPAPALKNMNPNARFYGL